MSPRAGELVLASGSMSRKALLTAAGVPFVADPADLDEDTLMASLKQAGPEAMAQSLAEQKALAVSHRHPGRTVLGGDSVIAFGSDYLSKCASLELLCAARRNQGHARSELCETEEVALALGQILDLRGRDVGRNRLRLRRLGRAAATNDDGASRSSRRRGRRGNEIDGDRLANLETGCLGSLTFSGDRIGRGPEAENGIIAVGIDRADRPLASRIVDCSDLASGLRAVDVPFDVAIFGLGVGRLGNAKRDRDRKCGNSGRKPALVVHRGHWAPLPWQRCNRLHFRARFKTP